MSPSRRCGIRQSSTAARHGGRARILVRLASTATPVLGVNGDHPGGQPFAPAPNVSAVSRVTAASTDRSRAREHREVRAVRGPASLGAPRPPRDSTRRCARSAGLDPQGQAETGTAKHLAHRTEHDHHGVLALRHRPPCRSCSAITSGGAITRQDRAGKLMGSDRHFDEIIGRGLGQALAAFRSSTSRSSATTRRARSRSTLRDVAALRAHLREKRGKDAPLGRLSAIDVRSQLAALFGDNGRRRSGASCRACARSAASS